MSGANRVGPVRVDIVETEIEGEISLYDPTNDSVMVLNETASDIWLLSDGENTLPEMVDLLARAYGVKPGEIREDVERTVASFVENGFISDGVSG